mgnify:FL=1|tara:strand:- start:2615 stop:3412 length:798 start_codon:yes stop_codon:yes gene_type:complete
MSKIKKSSLSTSVDKFLDGKITIEQLLDGGRSNTDTILLSAAVPVAPGYKVLDIGVGNGTSSIALGSNFKDITIIGIDNDPINIELATKNVILNKLEGNIIIRRADILKKNLSFSIGDQKNLKFDSIYMNPPYFDKDTINQSKSHYQSIAKYHDGSNLDHWINNSLKLLKFRGTITIINKIENLNRIICLLSGLGSITILPLISNMSGEVQRFILSFRKGSNAKTRVLSQVVLHQESGAFSNRVEDTLRGRARIDLTKSDYFYQI